MQAATADVPLLPRRSAVASSSGGTLDLTLTRTSGLLHEANGMLPLAPLSPAKVSTARKGKTDNAPSSMGFLAPVNEHWVQRGARGVSTEAASGSAEVAIMIMCTIVGVVIAALVSIMHAFIEAVQEQKEATLAAARVSGGAWAAWSLHNAISLAFGLLALQCVMLVPHARGSGLPQLIAYLNGVKLRKFTSFSTLAAKFLGVSFTMCAGLFCGPEGPIIHIGACVGKLGLRGLYRLPGLLSRLAPRCTGGTGGGGGPLDAFVHFKNDLDERDLVAIGAGAGVAAAFLAPISGEIR